MQMGEWSMVANIAIASVKASLVLWFFMHLKYEKRLFKLLLRTLDYDLDHHRTHLCRYLVPMIIYFKVQSTEFKVK